MPRRFTVDLTRMKPSIAQPDTSVSNSRPTDLLVAPKSIRSLPLDLENDLRTACTLIVNDVSAPEGQESDVRKKRATTLLETERPTELNKSGGLDSHPVRGFSQDSGSRALVYENEAVRVYRPVRKDDATAKSGQHSAGPAERPRPTHMRAQSTSDHLYVSVPTLKPWISAQRGSSLDTTRSAYQSDVTLDDHVDSTAVTSFAVTPARASKRGSGQTVQTAENTAPRARPWDAEEMRRKLDANRKTREEEHQRQSAILGKLTMPARKPVRSANEVDSGVESLFYCQNPASHPAVVAELSRKSLDQQDERRGRSSIRERAANSARSLSRGVRAFLRPSSRDARDSSASRPFSSRDVESTHTSAWIRPDRRASIDSARPTLSSSKTDSSLLTRMSRGSHMRFALRRPASSSVAKMPSAMSSAVGLRQDVRDGIDLNRKLPPLPTLGSWTGSDTLDGVSRETRRHTAVQGDASKSPPNVRDTLVEESADHSSGSDLDFDRPVSPMIAARHAFSPRLEMSATFCPGDFDVLGPMRTPSPISESSLQGVVADENRVLPVLDTSGVPLSPDDDESLELSPISPQVARLVTQLSNRNLRAQLVHNTASSRAPSRPSTALSLVQPLPFMPGDPMLNTIRTEEHDLLSRPTSSAHDRTVSRDGLDTTELSSYDTTRQNLSSIVPGLQPRQRDLPPIPTSSEHDGRIFNGVLDADTYVNAKPVVLLGGKILKKQWWKSATRKHDWMTDVEQSGSRSGVLMLDQVAAAPVVRFS